jgi:maleylacetate reductase
MLYGTYLAGVAFASAGSGMHHKICHVLGGAFNLPHAQTHAVVLPYVLAFNVPSAPEVAARLATALQGPTALEGLEALRRAVDAPCALRDIGFREDQIPEAVMLCLDAVPDSNPRAVDFAALERILRAAWAGDPAETLSTR